MPKCSLDIRSSGLSTLPWQQVAAIKHNYVTRSTLAVCTSPYLRLFAKELAKPEAGVFESRQFYQTDALRLMSHCMSGDEVALVAYKQRTIEKFVISAWQQKGMTTLDSRSARTIPWMMSPHAL